MTAAREIFDVSQDWKKTVRDADEIRTLLIPALQISSKSTCWRMNSDVQIDFI